MKQEQPKSHQEEIVYDLGFLTHYFETCPNAKELTAEKMDKIDSAISGIYDIITPTPSKKIKRIK